MMKRFHNPFQTRSQGGFTLIEVAVALLVLAVGMLGVAGMQSSGMKATHQSHLRAVAMTQAQDLADRIRANLNGLRGTNYTGGIPNTAPSPNCQTSANSCSNAQLALSDLYNWQTENASRLPSGQGAIACNDINPGTANSLEAGTDCIITVRWDGERNGATGTGCTGASTDLTCLRMRITP
jgi:type IV pilus assembly protein PilV